MTTQNRPYFASDASAATVSAITLVEVSCRFGEICDISRVLVFFEFVTFDLISLNFLVSYKHRGILVHLRKVRTKELLRGYFLPVMTSK